VVKIVRKYESPSSINTFRNCPRKYYYHYILGLDTKPTIHTIRGNIVHSVLEDFFNIELEDIENFNAKFEEILFNLFNYYWMEKLESLKGLGLENGEVKTFYNESLFMLNNFAANFSKKIMNELKNNLSLRDAFNKIRPKTEVYYVSDTYKIQGYIDAIHDFSGDVVLMDYKTSKSGSITPEYMLQLGLYALMYQEKHNILPKKVGIYFLASGEEIIIDVDRNLLLKAKMACEEIKICTLSNRITDYPRNITKLCDWGRGRCDFFNNCFGQKGLEEFK